MEDYVVPEFYDVLVGGELNPSGPGGGGGLVSDNGTLKFDIQSGFTNSGKKSIEGAYGTILEINDNDTMESVEAKYNSLDPAQKSDIMTTAYFKLRACVG